VPPDDRIGEESGQVLADDHRREAREEQALDKDRGSGQRGGRGAERRFGSPREAARHEEAPALQIDRAYDRGERGCHQDGPGRPRADFRSHDPGDEERAQPELRDGQRRRFPRRDERAQRRRRQDDRHAATEAWR
jgi:hypothetical protein